MYDSVLEDVLDHRHSRYIFPGGRGSTKSSFVGGICIPLVLISNPTVHAVCFRKIGNTIQTSIFPQVIWGIYQLGLEHLFSIPKNYSTPITYKPTGQKIYFMGLDDPNKVKSIKPEFGYIGITWFEELDQFAGENELRKVTQSTKRGGELFWDFRTFNPPISKNNWANEFTSDLELRKAKNTLIVRNTYKDVPEEWLGQEFIEEAEELKQKNPRAYEHEYGGIPVGTGGDVFQNVEELDMYSKRIIRDQHGELELPPLVETFDVIYNGMDVGFAMDPTRVVRCYFDRQRLDLYIFEEFSTMHNRSAQIYKLVYEERKMLKNEDMLICDPGGGGLFVMADFKAYGAFVRPAEKGPGSVDYGIKWLQGLNHIYIDKNHCPDTWKEFVDYEYEQDKDGNFISAYPDENNHSIDACLTGEAEVFTPNGFVRIDELVGKEDVLYAYDNGKIIETQFVNCRKTYDEAEIYVVELEDGRTVECTYDHKILTSNRGYVMAKDLTENDDVVCIY